MIKNSNVMVANIETGIIGLWDKIWPWLLDHGVKIFLIALAAFAIQRVLIRFTTRVIRAAVVPKEDSSEMEEKMRENTLIRVFKWIINIVVYLIAGLMILQELGVPIGPLLTGAGIVGVAVGFGSQYLVRDIITGFFLIFENHYRIGDEVEFNGTRGIVEDITLRVTTLRDINGTVHTVPHGDITRVSNYSKSYAKVNLDVRVPYSADVEHVIGVINRVGEKLASDPEWEDKILKKPQFLRINDLGDSSVIFKIIGETKPLMQHAVTGELRKRLKKEFDKEGIEMPFPRVVVHQNRS
jgi:small conductance mechanosensitive channel